MKKQISIYLSQVYFGPDIPNMFLNEREDVRDTQR